MLLNKFGFLAFFMGVSVVVTINCMHEGNVEQDLNVQCVDEALMEQLPNELLLLILIQRTNNIINTNHPSQAEKEFKEFFNSISLVSKRFGEFEQNLKDHFAKNKKYSTQDIRNMIFSKLNHTW